MQKKLLSTKVYSFLYDVWAERKSGCLRVFFKFIFLPAWIFYYLFHNEDKIVLFIRTEIFGLQLAEFQALKKLAVDTDRQIYFNHHPEVVGKFIFNKQLEQILQLSNVKMIGQIFIISRLFADDIGLTISRIFKLKRKKILKTFRSMGFTYSLLQNKVFQSFPLFSKNELKEHRNYLSNCDPRIIKNKPIIATQIRTGNFPRYAVPSRVSDKFRIGKISEINISIKEFGKNNFQFVRIGHFEERSAFSTKKVLDLRKDLAKDNKLQLSIFASCDAYFGSSNGPVAFFVIQKKPCLLLSVYPIDIEYPKDPKSIVVVPKLIWSNTNNRYLTLKEQFGIPFMQLQNKYDDRLLMKEGFEPKSLPQDIISKIFSNWQTSILLNKKSDFWQKKTIHKSNELRIAVNRPNLPSIPIEYFNYLENFN